MFYSLARQLLFLLPPEASHNLALEAMSLLEKSGMTGLVYPRKVEAPARLFGLEVDNSAGLAAGLDKNGDYIDALAACGFGFLEIGTVTPRPQPGNPRPRLFRLPAQEAIINRMGFNNKGVDYLVDRVKQSRYQGVLGINIGKNFDTPVEGALVDYIICMQKAWEHASYITFNISSPNTPGLRNLQYGEQISHLLGGVKEEAARLEKDTGKTVPLVLKVAPDSTAEELRLMADKILEFEMDGVIATNTTTSRPGIEGLPVASESGGLSGKPLKQAADAALTVLSERLAGRVPLVGVGGIDKADDGLDKINLGASAVQLYTGFIYHGPQLVHDTARLIASADR